MSIKMTLYEKSQFYFNKSMHAVFELTGKSSFNKKVRLKLLYLLMSCVREFMRISESSQENRICISHFQMASFLLCNTTIDIIWRFTYRVAMNPLNQCYNSNKQICIPPRGNTNSTSKIYTKNNISVGNCQTIEQSDS